MIKKQPKPKQCVCGTQFTPFNSLQKYCGPKCNHKVVTGNMEGLDLMKISYQTLKQLALGLFQDWIKVRDKNCGCYTCEAKKDAKVVWHAGHFFKKELCSGFIFDEEFTKKQCDYCNCALEGNLEVYEQNLIKEQGQTNFEINCIVSDGQRNYKWSRLELIEKYNHYKQKLEELKK